MTRPALFRLIAAALLLVAGVKLLPVSCPDLMVNTARVDLIEADGRVTYRCKP